MREILFRGKRVDNGKWDMIIAHPPCTYLSNCATRMYSLKATPAEKVVWRWEQRALAAVFFMRLMLADCDRICVENPVGFMSKAYQKPSQYIEPFYFCDSADSDEYVTKKTGLWLKNLPPLKRTNNLPRPIYEKYYSEHSGTMKSKAWCISVKGGGEIMSARKILMWWVGDDPRQLSLFGEPEYLKGAPEI